MIVQQMTGRMSASPEQLPDLPIIHCKYLVYPAERCIYNQFIHSVTVNILNIEIGMAWIIDNEKGFIWHNGGTGHYNSYLGFCPETGTAAVVLSNLSPNDRIPATVLGIKKLQELNQ
ncbi:MAG: serine hydrolase [Clostridiales bacterium]|nr:serine hydrolase [Clostridiales bacterium]